MTDKDIIQGCIKEDRHYQRELFNRYAGKMLSVCRRYARHRLEAEDLMQDGFIKVYDNIHKFSFKGSFEGWIRRIMINTALKNYKKSSFQKEQIGIESYMGGSEEAKAVDRISEEEILEVISGLPDGYRLVFNLYAIEGYSHKDIGEMLNIKESTSRSQLVKARKMLQKKILIMQKIGA